MVPDPLSALQAELAVHQPIDRREARSLELVRRALAELERPLDQTAGPTHVTGSAIVVGPRGVVLHRHRRLERWLQPGGHLERGEHASAAARREAVEETGLEVEHPPTGPRLVHVDVHPGGRGHVHLDVRYVLMAPDATPAPEPGESQAIAWFAWEAALLSAGPGLRGALLATRARLTVGWRGDGPQPVTRG